ncbi:MAG: O-antigen ligase family protein [Planctomycetota bacterium]
MKFALWIALWFAIPLAHSGFFGRPYHDLKELLAGAVMLALVVLTPGRLWPTRIVGPGWLIVALVASLAVSAVGSEYRVEALARTSLDLILIAWGLWWCAQPNRPQLMTLTLVTLAIITAVICVSGFRSALENSTLSRFDPLGHRYYWAEFLMGVVPLLVLHPQRLRPWWPALAVVMPALGMLLVLGRRMPIAGLLAGLGFAGLVYWATRYRQSARGSAERRTLLLRAAAVAGGIILIGGVVTLSSHDPNGLVARLGHAYQALRSGEPNQLAKVRLPLYEAAPAAIAARPTGYGRGSYPLAYFAVVGQHAREPWAPTEIPSYHPYNTFLHLTLEGGWVAGLAWLALWVGAIAGLLRRLLGSGGRGEFYGLALLAGMVAFTCDSLTFSTIEFPLTRMLSTFYLAAAWAWIRETPRGGREPAASPAGSAGIRTLTPRAWAVARVALAIGAISTLVPYYFANHASKVAESALRLGRESVGLAPIESALRWNPSRRGQVLTALRLFAGTGQLSQGIEHVEAYLALHPHDALVRVEFAKALFQRDGESGLPAHRAELARVLEYWPGCQYALERLGDLAIANGDLEAAARYYATYFTHYPTSKRAPLADRERYDILRKKLDRCRGALELREASGASPR